MKLRTSPYTPRLASSAYSVGAVRITLLPGTRKRFGELLELASKAAEGSGFAEWQIHGALCLRALWDDPTWELETPQTSDLTPESAVAMTQAIVDELEAWMESGQDVRPARVLQVALNSMAGGNPPN